MMSIDEIETVKLVNRFKSNINFMIFNSYFNTYLQYMARLMILHNFKWLCRNFYQIMPLYYHNEKDLKRKIILANYSSSDVEHKLVFDNFLTFGYYFDESWRNIHCYRVTTTDETLKDVFLYNFFIVESIFIDSESLYYEFEYRVSVWQSIMRCTKKCDSLWQPPIGSVPHLISNYPYRKDTDKTLFTIGNNVSLMKQYENFKTKKSIFLGNFVADYHPKAFILSPEFLYFKNTLKYNIMKASKLNYKYAMRKNIEGVDHLIIDLNSNVRGSATHLNRIDFNPNALNIDYYDIKNESYTISI